MWITLTVDNLLEGLAGPEMEAVRDVALEAGQDNPIDDVIYGVTREIRGRVGACHVNNLGEGLTIPDELKDAAVALMVFRVCNRLPTTVFLNETRVAAKNDALRLLEAVAKCDLLLEQPETETDEELAVAEPTFCGRPARFKRWQQEGI